MRVLCGIDGSDTDADAVRQAALIAGAEGQLEVVFVTQATQTGASPLESAGAIAVEMGIRTETRVVEDDAWSGLADASAGRDLLVLGLRPHTRAGGILHGSVSTRAMHDSAIPVLLARSGEAGFPQRIVCASNGDTASKRAIALTAAIARTHSSAVTLVTIDHVEVRERRHALHEEAEELARALGAEPEILLRSGEPDEEIVAAARLQEASLLVLGSGGKRGIRALGSVSEKVAHKAPCSVLVARHAG